MAGGENHERRPESLEKVPDPIDAQHHTRPKTAADISTTPPVVSQKPSIDTLDNPKVCPPSPQSPPSHRQDEYALDSESSNKESGTLGSSTDRVFPISSLVGIGLGQSPISLTGRTASVGQGYFTPSNAPADVSGVNVDKGNTGETPHDALGSSEIDEKYEPRAGRSESGRFPEGRQTDRKGSILGTQNRPEIYSGGSGRQQISDSGSGSEISVPAKKTEWAGLKGTDTGQSSSLEDRLPRHQESTSGHVTARFKHVVTAEGHAIITGREGEILQRCEDEPIHIPGAVQSFGLLIALEEKEDGQLIVRIVSENSRRIIGYTPQQLFKLDSFCDILSEGQQHNLLDHIDFIREGEIDLASNGPDVFTISVRSSKLWCAMHISPSHGNLIICEFELENDEVYPLVPPNEMWPGSPEDTLNCDPTDEEYIESTFNQSKPLRLLRSARKRSGESGAMEAYNIMSQVQDQLASAPNLERFLKILVGVIKELTGFHRVMIYQFDADFHGHVVTELVDPRATKDLYRGLHFPASDIPKQARDLYKINKVRLLYDRDLETARLVCRNVEDLKTPLDLTFSYLRAMSPIHNKYLANMAVRSSMSISINAFNELWGLISCHSYGSKGMRVSFAVRNMCRLLGDTASRNIERLSYASRLQARKLIDTMPSKVNSSGYIVVSSDDLLELFDAEFGLITIHNESKILGDIEDSQEALVMLEYLRTRKITSVIASQDIKEDFPDLQYAPGFSVISGLLLVPLSAGGEDFIVFFRPGQTREVKWAGNPYEKFLREGTEGYLEPRASFKIWRETVAGKCSEWTEQQVETAAALCLVYGKFIKVWRQREAAMEGSRLTKILLSNTAHEVRTPLNAIINYLEIALEGTLDQETRDNLARSHSASKSLIYVINDLLDLTKTEEGKDLINDEMFDLLATVREVTDPFRGDARRKGIQYEVVEHPGLPRWVYGDRRCVRQAISNVIANAIRYTTSGWVRVELWLERVVGDKAIVEVVVQDSGAGMSNKQLDALFRDLEQVSTDEDELFRHRDISNRPLTDQRGDRVLGLGLAVVARIVRNMNGQVRLKSKEGEGSRFVIQLPFSLSKDDGQAASSDENTSSATAVVTPPPLVSRDELTLVDNCAPLGAQSDIRKHGGERRTSLPSLRSGSSKSIKSYKSEVDRLIKRISGSFGEQKEEPAGTLDTEQLQILVAEDDPINSRIIRKRLEKSGHKVHGTTNGEECVAAYQEKPTLFDVVLMDMQMPIVDGAAATKMIRSFEKNHLQSCLSSRAIANGRIPIFAVSASLVERERQQYINTGFDGWILKPIDFKRLGSLLAGIVEDDTRNACLYHTGEWECGGWFQKRTLSVQSSS